MADPVSLFCITHAGQIVMFSLDLQDLRDTEGKIGQFLEDLRAVLQKGGFGEITPCSIRYNYIYRLGKPAVKSSLLLLLEEVATRHGLKLGIQEEPLQAYMSRARNF